MDKAKKLLKTLIISAALLAISGQIHLTCAESLAVPGSQKAKPPQYWQKFAGVWEGNNDYELMRLGLTINTANKSVLGWHKAIAYDGNRADMVSEDTMSIEGSFANDLGEGVLFVNFVSGHNPKDRGSGTAKITFINDTLIKWEVISREGVSYIPSEIELKKISPVANAPSHILFRNAWSVFDSKTNKQFSLERSIDEAISALGQAESKSLFLGAEAKSGNIYHYAGVDILAQDEPAGSIGFIHISNDRFITPGNLKVGDSLEKVVGIYGQADKPKKFENLEWHSYVLDSKKGIRVFFGINSSDKLIKIIRINLLHSSRQGFKLNFSKHI